MSAKLLFIVHLVTTWFLVGLIWTIQWLHYPLFAHVPHDAFKAYEQFHVRWITPLVGPAMCIELATGLLLWVIPYHFITTTELWLGTSLIIAIWLSTMFIQVPLHSSLEQGYSAEVISSLVFTNWIRTLAWTVRGLILILVLSRALQD